MCLIKFGSHAACMCVRRMLWEDLVLVVWLGLPFFINLLALPSQACLASSKRFLIFAWLAVLGCASVCLERPWLSWGFSHAGKDACNHSYSDLQLRALVRYPDRTSSAYAKSQLRARMRSRSCGRTGARGHAYVKTTHPTVRLTTVNECWLSSWS